MDLNDHFYMGYISKTHGVKGEVTAILDVDSTEKYSKLTAVVLKGKEGACTCEVEHLRPGKGTAIIKFKGTDTPEAAKALQGMEIYAALSFLPPAGKNQFYLHDVIGFTVCDKTHGEIGPVQAVLEYPGQYLIQVMRGKKELLIPVNADIVLEVDHPRKTVMVDVPEGLLEL